MLVSDERLRRYRISRDQFNRMHALQKGLCGCCAVDLSDDPEGVAFDHDHTNNDVRGILCRDCNTLIGRLGDNLEAATQRFEQITRYLTIRRLSVKAAIATTSVATKLQVSFEGLLEDTPTWTARMAMRLSYEFNRHNVDVPHRDDDYFYGCGSQVGKLERANRVASILADVNHWDIAPTKHPEVVGVYL